MSQEKGLYRSNNRVLGGVCAGVAEYFNFDITLTRLVYALLTIFTAFSGVVVYIIAWIVMPEKIKRW
ncbi:MAG: PspC domain-containing protein [Prevotella sp.]|nr:PspC domain-containing protein [Prevotella sp.]MDD7461089.1 PspC domain-containing protein [Prevotellaceae bacterium]MDY3364947.1 PspC domain-containing protein [Prevotella sp.]MDY3851802.1 PspC domain-containing protein [Prevotella sp.]